MVDKVKQAIQSLWEDTCTVIVREKRKDPVTKITDFVEVIKYEKQPCKLSYKSITSTSDKEIATVRQVTKLFIDPSLDVPEGSKIVVTHKGVTMEYCRSGQPALHTNHQEIILELFERWA